MNDRLQPSDDMLRNVDVPILAAGPHRQDLRRSLMREARRRAERPVHPWLARLAYSVGVVIVLAVGVIWAAQVYRDRVYAVHTRPAVITARSTTTNTSLPQGFGAVIGNGSGGEALSEREARQQADAIRAAVDNGNVQLQQTLTTTTGGAVYIYRVNLANGRYDMIASDDILIADPLEQLQHEDELKQAVAQDKGQVIGESVSDSGVKIYQYRVRLSDGSSATYGSDHEPDPLKRQQHQRELEQAIAQGRGDLYTKIDGPGAASIYMMRVTLSDGTVKVYGSAAKPKQK